MASGVPLVETLVVVKVRKDATDYGGTTLKTYDLNEAAEFLKCSAETVRDIILRGDGELPAARIGQAHVIMEDDLIEYLRRQVRAQTLARKQAAANDPSTTSVTPIRTTRAQRRGQRRRPLPELPDV